MDAKRTARTIQIRKRFIRLLDRNRLEVLSGTRNPWLADRSTLEHAVLVRWPGSEIAAEITKLFEEVS